MRTRALHRVFGIVMALPFAAWAITGAIFFIKPGYGGAYDSLAVKMYALEQPLSLAPSNAWLEVRIVKTILGAHLLVRTSEGWQQLDPVTQQPRAVPNESEVRAIVADACATNLVRYGRVVSVHDLTATTDTGVRVTLDWKRLSLSQRGRDTDRIDRLYRIHYLQWTGQPDIDRILGATGLASILLLSVLGVVLFFRAR